MVDMCKDLEQPHAGLNKAGLFDNIVAGLEKLGLPLDAKTVYAPRSAEPPRTFELPSPAAAGGKSGAVVTFKQGEPIKAAHLEAVEALARRVAELKVALGKVEGGAEVSEQ
jgi:hypothetical protein